MTDWHQPLRDDVRQLGDLLGQVLKVHDGPELFDRVERVRALSKRAHAGDDRAFDELADLMRALPEAVALRVARAPSTSDVGAAVVSKLMDRGAGGIFQSRRDRIPSGLPVS